jgi:hypothetical protein
MAQADQIRLTQLLFSLIVSIFKTGRLCRDVYTLSLRQKKHSLQWSWLMTAAGRQRGTLDNGAIRERTDSVYNPARCGA